MAIDWAASGGGVGAGIHTAGVDAMPRMCLAALGV